MTDADDHGVGTIKKKRKKNSNKKLFWKSFCSCTLQTKDKNSPKLYCALGQKRENTDSVKNQSDSWFRCLALLEKNKKSCLNSCVTSYAKNVFYTYKTKTMNKYSV